MLFIVLQQGIKKLYNIGLDGTGCKDSYLKYGEKNDRTCPPPPPPPRYI